MQAAACSAAGACGSWLFVSLIIADAEQYTATTPPPLKSAQQIKMQPLKALALATAAYRYICLCPCTQCMPFASTAPFADTHGIIAKIDSDIFHGLASMHQTRIILPLLCRQALKPRLLIPVALLAGFTTYRELFEHRLGLIEAGSLLAGFLSFKVINAAWSWLYSDLHFTTVHVMTIPEGSGICLVPCRFSIKLYKVCICAGRPAFGPLG